MLKWCRLFKRCRNLPAEHGVEGVQAAEAVMEPTCRHCVAGAQAVLAVSEPTCRALCCGGAGC